MGQFVIQLLMWVGKNFKQTYATIALWLLDGTLRQDKPPGTPIYRFNFVLSAYVLVASGPRTEKKLNQITTIGIRGAFTCVWVCTPMDA